MFSPLGVQGHCDTKRRIITLGSAHYWRVLDHRDQSIREHHAWVHRVLLHEMVHLKVEINYGELGHGKRFLQELRRLAKLGESWADEEIKQYQRRG
jgi:hypothetical protein